MNHRPSSRHRIRSGSRRRGDDQPIRMHRCDQIRIDIAIQLHHATRRSSIDHDVVQNLQLA